MYELKGIWKLLIMLMLLQLLAINQPPRYLIRNQQTVQLVIANEFIYTLLKTWESDSFDWG